MMSLLQMNLNPTGKIPDTLEKQASVEASGFLSVPLEEDKSGIEDSGEYGGNATCSFLYSDVGEFYSRFGWSVVGNRHVEWPPLSSSTSSPDLPSTAKCLKPEELVEVAKLDREYFVRKLSKPSKAIRFCVDDPEATSWQWLITRSSFYANLLHPNTPPPTHFGLRLSEQAYAVWMFDYVERKVAVLRLRFSSASDFAVLISAVRGEAAKFGMTKVVAWNVDLKALGIELTTEDQEILNKDGGEGKLAKYEEELGEGAKVVERKGSGASLPAIAWYGDKAGYEPVEWICNEYGWWC